MMQFISIFLVPEKGREQRKQKRESEEETLDGKGYWKFYAENEQMRTNKKENDTDNKKLAGKQKTRENQASTI